MSVLGRKEFLRSGLTLSEHTCLVFTNVVFLIRL